MGFIEEKYVIKNSNKKYSSHTAINEILANAIESYEKGNLIEGIILISYLLEMDMTIIWYVYSKRKLRHIPFDEFEKLDFNNLTKVLFDIQLINKETKNRLDLIRKTRNNIAHYLFSEKVWPIDKLDQNFNEAKVQHKKLLEIITKKWNESIEEIKQSKKNIQDLENIRQNLRKNQ